MKEEFTHEFSKGEKIKEYCSICGPKTNHEILHGVNEASSWSTEDSGPISLTAKYQIIQCMGCDSISFRIETWFSEAEDLEFGFDGTSVDLYPNRGESRRTPILFKDIPKVIEKIYHEILLSYNHDLDLLCAAGIRALIEGISNHLKIEGGTVSQGGDESNKARFKNNLEGKIFGLLEAGKIRQADAEALHELRFIGNAALHELQSISKQELALSIDIVEHTLESIYVINKKSNLLKQIRSKKDFDF